MFVTPPPYPCHRQFPAIAIVSLCQDEPIYDLSKSVFVRNNTGSVSLSRSIINGAGGFGARDDGAPGTSQR